MENKQALTSLAALANETRLAIFRLLVQAGPDGVQSSKIGEALDVPSSSLAFHLKELSYSNLVTSRQDGRFVIYIAQFQTMNTLIDFLTENCCGGGTCDERVNLIR